MDRIALQILEDGWEQDGQAMRRGGGQAARHEDEALRHGGTQFFSRRQHRETLRSQPAAGG